MAADAGFDFALELDEALDAELDEAFDDGLGAGFDEAAALGFELDERVDFGWGDMRWLSLARERGAMRAVAQRVAAACWIDAKATRLDGERRETLLGPLFAEFSESRVLRARERSRR